VVAPRVLHVIPAVAARYGGPSQAVIGMCRGLAERGVETLVATTDADGRGRLVAELGQPTRYEGVPAMIFRRQWSEAFKYSRPLARWLDDNVARFAVVHIHAVFSHACLAAADACQRAGRPYIVRPLGTLDPWSMRQKWVQKRLLWQLGARKMMRSAAAVHYTSREEQRLAESTLGLTRGTVIPLGVDEELLQRQVDPRLFRQRQPLVGSRSYVLALGRLHPKKGIEFLLDSFLQVTRQSALQDWRLVIAGDGDAAYVDRLKALVRQSGGQERVVFTGWVEGELKAAVLAGAGLTVLASKQENFAVSMIESLACGVPVLVSPQVNTADDIAAAGAGWVAPLASADFQFALTSAMRDEAERRRRGAAGRGLVEARFRWRAVADQLVELYRACAEPDPMSSVIRPGGKP
jgi:glycosyltransferase involved in cell wall biosynthesis